MQNISINNKYLCHNKSGKVIYAFNLAPPSPFLLIPNNKFMFLFYLINLVETIFVVFFIGFLKCLLFLMLSFLVFQSLNLFAWKDWLKKIKKHNEANIFPLIDGFMQTNVTCQSEHLIININKHIFSNINLCFLVFSFYRVNWLSTELCQLMNPLNFL